MRSTPSEELVDGSPRHPEHLGMVGDGKAWREKINGQPAAAGQPGLAVQDEVIVEGTSMEKHASTEDDTRPGGNFVGTPPPETDPGGVEVTRSCAENGAETVQLRTETNFYRIEWRSS